MRRRFLWPKLTLGGSVHISQPLPLHLDYGLLDVLVDAAPADGSVEALAVANYTAVPVNLVGLLPRTYSAAPLFSSSRRGTLMYSFPQRGLIAVGLFKP